jgi:CMP-N-acetylneuraminic acid synthetase
MSNKILGIILARKNSKRLPGKNTRLLNGKPLISYTIESAINSGIIDTLIVSTDDLSIADIMAEYYNEYEKPIMHFRKRPDYLATDTAPSEECILHAMDTVGKHDYVCLLQATSPLRTGDDIRDAFETMIGYGWNGIASRNGNTDVHNGAIFIDEWDKLYNTRQLTRNRRYYMPSNRSVDIDTIDDFNRAEKLLRSK